MSGELLAGRYELVAPVGKGATGQVWQGLDTLLLRPVAIKLVDLVGARDPAMAERFRREGVAIAGINHDAIVKVFDTGTDPARGWLVMELLSGPNCNALVRDGGPLSYEIGMPLLARVADGLQAAHDGGITHRDVKPANIVLDAAPDADGTLPDLADHPELSRPVLVDFGIARIVDEAGAQLTRPATAIGTAAYMSPEQARGQDVGPASDVYSLACVAYYLFLGRPPFVADSSLAVAHSQAFDTPMPLAELAPDAPLALDTLLTRMLSKDASLRPSAREVAAELRAISVDPQMAPSVPLPAPVADLADAAPTSLLDAPATELAPAPARTAFQHAGRWFVGLLIVLLAAALAYTWWTRGQDPEPAPTVTLTTTATHTSHSTSTVPPPSTSAPATSAAPSTSAAPTTTQPTSAPTTAPTQSAPTTTQPPPTTAPTTAPATTEAPPVTDLTEPAPVPEPTATAS